MKKLKLPIIRGETLKKKVLSMDEYYEFVLFNLKYAFDRKAYREWKKMSVVHAPFVL